jgi:dephospho-CoA kinase
MIIGLTGTNGAGKTAAAEHLRRRGFRYDSLSDEIRRELERQGKPATRENLIVCGNELRAAHGPAVLAERVRGRLEAGCDYVIDSIRNPSEVLALRQLPGFALVHLDAPRRLRYERALQRGDARSPASYEEFAEQEEREMRGENPLHQQLRACYEMADHTIWNGGGVEQLKDALDELIAGRA